MFTLTSDAKTLTVTCTRANGGDILTCRVALFLAASRHLAKRGARDGVIVFPKHNEKRVRALVAKFSA